MSQDTTITETGDATDQVLSGDSGQVSDEQAGGAVEPDEGTAGESDAQSDQGNALTSAPSTGSGGGSNGAADVRPADVIDIDAELNAKEALADQLSAGTITYEDYAKGIGKHEKRIIQAQRELAKPAKEVAQTIQQQKAASAYWKNWGKGKDLAQIQHGKTVPVSRAKLVYAQVEAEFDANPRYQRPEFQRNRDALIYDKFIDALSAEATKKPGATRAPAPNTRASGNAGIGGGTGAGTAKTARQRLEDGEINLGDDAQRLGMM
jgi:hypothetical protein